MMNVWLYVTCRRWKLVFWRRTCFSSNSALYC